MRGKKKGEAEIGRGGGEKGEGKLKKRKKGRRREGGMRGKERG